MQVKILNSYESVSAAAAHEVRQVLNSKPNAVLGFGDWKHAARTLSRARPNAPRGRLGLLAGDYV